MKTMLSYIFAILNTIFCLKIINQYLMLENQCVVLYPQIRLKLKFQGYFMALTGVILYQNDEAEG